MALLNFLGAIQQVTGSCYLIETFDKKNILLECGMQQGGDSHENDNDNNDNGKSNGSAFAFNPEHIDAVVISHAHIDHSGMLPRLVSEGFRGPIFATEATCELMELMLLDSAHIQEKDAEWENRWRARRGKKAIKPLYVSQDAERVLKQRKPVSYEKRVEVVPGVHVTFADAGHIIGAAIVKLEFAEPNDSVRTLVFSGDLGSTCSPLMKTPAILKHADVLLLESTYGDRDHRCNEETLDELVAILEQADKDGGNVMIPAFSVGRTQDILFHLGRFYQEGRLPQHTVYLDSPMAIRANDIYFRHREDFDEENRAMLKKHNIHNVSDWLPILKLTPTPEESMAINDVKSGAIIVAGSGMCNGGRIVHHFKHNLWRTDCHLIFTGFQARGTTGRAIVDGVKSVRVFREDIMVGAQVHTLGGFSAHAGQSQLIEWASHFENRPELHLIHGELDKMLILQSEFKKRLNWDANIPELGDRIAL
ncbi:MAG: MBL fold metallo-hydrolase [Thiopseudomonas sp.]|jgi:metallo-beta-lactamase family protein|nr:MBL fold metallo-hydrolase [Thiopseudomonas sp.]MBP7958689.1 MBL fold metallo-hydrolase [Thiopseudomonas sp.]MBP8770657.1 MBL fold metallo-hydrolase [Thiopseudomonas sp.]HHX05762.1 MBL fold metallo-hydrolase [Pseudomonas sp.]